MDQSTNKMERMKQYNQTARYGLLLLWCTFAAWPIVYSQDTTSNVDQSQGIYELVATYAKARETKDSVLLESILADNVDQLVSSGTWRRGKKESMQGMMKSSAGNPGKRTLKIDKIRFLDSESVLADARYEIQNSDGTVRKMWSTFIIVHEGDGWKITAIRNMLPSRPQ